MLNRLSERFLFAGTQLKESPGPGFLFLLFFIISSARPLPALTPGRYRMAPTRNYIEYNRGISSPTRTDLYMRTDSRELTFHNIRMQDQSFFPDNNFIPNAFLVHFRTGEYHRIINAATEPYYGIRFYHFFKFLPNLGVGLEFIHLKVGLEDMDQLIDVTGTGNGQPVAETVPAGQYFQRFNISHGVNHFGFTIVYRLLFFPDRWVTDGRVQPYLSFAVGPAIPHLEIDIKDESGRVVDRAYSYQLGFPNLGFSWNTGVRIKIFRHFGLYFEYKLTYSHLRAMFFEDESIIYPLVRIDTLEEFVASSTPGTVRSSFWVHHFVWGFSFIL